MLGLEQERLALAIQIRTNDGKAAQRDARKVIGHQVQELGVGAGNARMHAALGLHTGPQRGGRALKLLVGYEALDEDLA